MLLAFLFSIYLLIEQKSYKRNATLLLSFFGIMALIYLFGVDDLTYESANRFTLALLFTVTSNLYFNFEYSHAQRDLLTGGEDDLNELYLEGLLTF